MESWSWGELSGSNGAQGWSLTSAAWMLYIPQVDRCRFDILTKGTELGGFEHQGWPIEKGRFMPRGWECGQARLEGGLEVARLALTVSLMLLSCPHSRMCHFFLCVRLPVCLSETKEVQAGRSNSVTRMSLPVSPGCRSVSITTRGFPSLVPKFRLRRNSTGKHNEIILRPVVLFFKRFFLVAMQTTTWKVDLPILFNQP